MANKRNSEGYWDPTAYCAEKNVEREKAGTARAKDAEIERQANHLIGALKWICECGGFEIVGRIQIRHRGSGREFR